jgi:alpha-beta hydrolase superfamily lysophospholipase
MERVEGSFEGTGGLELYYQSWQPEQEPRAVVVIVHGFGEHSGRYMNVVNALIPAGCAVYAFDLRGHGRSSGQWGHINAWEEYRQDLRIFLELVAQKEPSKPVFLMGHSLGALIVLEYVLHRPPGLSGAIISAAPIEPIADDKGCLIVAAQVVSRVWPTFPMSLGLDASALSRDPEVVRAYQEDPLVHDRGTARAGAEALSTIEWVKARAADMSLPILLIHGEADQISSSNGSRWLFETIAFPDKELRIYPGGYHESHNDINYEEVMHDLKKWLDDHLPEV